MTSALGDMRAAGRDLRGIFTSGSTVSASLQPRVIAFARDRIQTFSEALGEFSAGYSQGTQEARSPAPSEFEFAPPSCSGPRLVWMEFVMNLSWGICQ